MSEYIEIQPEATGDPHTMRLITNLTLAEDGGNGYGEQVERYSSPKEREEGSPLAQTLAYVEGISQLHIDGNQLTVVRHPDTDWHIIIADISAAIRDFFL
jgi:hypothetical protein